MDSLLPPLVGTFLAEWGDRTQFLVILLAARFGGSARMLAGIAAAAILNSLLAAFGGKLIAEIINFQAITLMMAIALLFAAAGGFWPQTAPKLAGAGTAHAMWISFFAFGVLEFGDKSQFLTATLAARSQSWWLAGLGAGAGIILANVPAVILSEKTGDILPLRAIRLGASVLLLIAAAISAIFALRLF